MERKTEAPVALGVWDQPLASHGGAIQVPSVSPVSRGEALQSSPFAVDDQPFTIYLRCIMKTDQTMLSKHTLFGFSARHCGPQRADRAERPMRHGMPGGRSAGHGHHASGGMGRHGGGAGDGSGHGGRGGRMFEQGAIKLLALSLVAERPCYGYELIKHIEGLVGGDYSPSPGVVYPTLTYLVDMGWATVQDGEGGRKQYTITPAGLDQLAQQSTELASLKMRLQQGRERMAARRSPDIERAMDNLKAVLHQRLAEGQSSAALTRRIATAIDEAALAIRQLEA